VQPFPIGKRRAQFSRSKQKGRIHRLHIRIVIHHRDHGQHGTTRSDAGLDRWK
jgi:hypothetical protein